MPRYARPHVTGGLLHVISRFHNRRYLMNTKGAREQYLSFLAKAWKSHDTRIIAYCLMSSHIHLVLQLGTMPLSSFTRSVHSGWAIWLNRRKKGLGTVMADRPGSTLVHSESYAKELVRYVHNNPVRAGVVKAASESEWSSHRAYVGLEEIPEWLDTTPILGSHPRWRSRNQAAFDQFVNEGRAEPRRPEFSGELSHALAKEIRKIVGGPVEISYPVLGPDEFVRDAYREQLQRNEDAQKLDSRINAEVLMKALCQELSIDPALMDSNFRPIHIAKARALLAYAYCDRLSQRQVEVADLLNVRPSAVSKMLLLLRRDGLTQDEHDAVARVISRVSDGSFSKNSSLAKADAKHSRVVALKRRRKGSKIRGAKK